MLKQTFCSVVNIRVTLVNNCFPLLRARTLFSLEHTNVPSGAVAHVVIVAVPFGVPSARAQTV